MYRVVASNAFKTKRRKGQTKLKHRLKSIDSAADPEKPNPQTQSVVATMAVKDATTARKLALVLELKHDLVSKSIMVDKAKNARIRYPYITI